MIDPVTLSRMLGQAYAPTAQQAAVIGADPGPMLVVAGAGAGKTETMAARVVWLVANGHVRPEEILGLTFTRKAARELGQRIRRRLGALASSRDFRAVADPAVLESLEAIAPTTATYDSYAGSLVSEYGLLLPAEPVADILDGAGAWTAAWDLVTSKSDVDQRRGAAEAAKRLLNLSEEMDGRLADPADARAETEALLHVIAQTEAAPRQKTELHSKLVRVVDAQRDRLGLIPLVEELRARFAAAGARTFTRQMALAAQLAVRVAEVGESERARHRVVMLDEYQDTSHSQRVLLRALYAGAAVTAVGDPMQAIYGWRGATAANLAGFPGDFPTAAGEPAQTLQLTTSWRNPVAVLDVANEVSRRAFAGRERTVEELSARPGAGRGALELSLHPTAAEELAWVADRLAQEYRDARAEGRRFEAAALVRRNADCAAIHAALSERDVPSVIVGVGGLLSVPEVEEVVAHLRAVADPGDDEAMLRLLTGPRWRLGAADVAALSRRAAFLARARGERPEPADGPLERLADGIDAIAEELEAPPSGLGFAVDDPGEAEGYSEEGLRRIRALGAQLEGLRRATPAPSLPDLVARVEEVFGIRAETAAAGGPAGTAHLDRLADVAADFARRTGGGAAAFLGWLRLAAEHDRGLEPGVVPVRGDRVEIMTVHKAKGLEWDVVAVPHVTATQYDEATAETWLTNPDRLPPAHEGEPQLDSGGAAHQGELAAAMDEHKAEIRDGVVAELRRLFYVAVTRSARLLLVSACHRMSPDRAKPEGPSEHLLELARRFPEAVGPWTGEAPAEPPARAGGGEVAWPADPLGARRPRVEEAAEMVRAARAGDAAEPLERDISRVWADETTLLLEELARAGEEVEVPAPAQLSVSEYRAALSDPAAYARRLARPVPFKPSRFARRGTAFHAWLEARGPGSALIDEGELAELAAGMEPLDQPELEALQEAFAASEWADRVPERVEEPFDIGIGGVRVRGRIDAVFRIGGRWAVVDWKTGRRPSGEEARRAALQLAIYRIAWADRRRAEGEDVAPEDVRAMFHYVRGNETVEPGGDLLPDRIELAEALRGLIRGADDEGRGER
ncbi:ATP-dependent helicase [Corynebacterium sp. 335C]